MLCRVAVCGWAPTGGVKWPDVKDSKARRLDGEPENVKGYDEEPEVGWPLGV
jgi:hypothetical protein